MSTVIKSYLKKRAEREPWQLKNQPKKRKYQFVICIPAFAEAEYLPYTLQSISAQDKQLLENTIVIIVINNGPNPEPDILRNNTVTEQIVLNNRWGFEVVPVDAYSRGNDLPIKYAGVGLARKIGFDLALPYTNGSTIFCSLDADTLISSDYLPVINKFYQDKTFIAGVTDFSHQVPKSKEKIKSIKIYEDILRHISSKMKDSGSPYFYHSIGSTMTCLANAYAAVGGIPRKKATEDFYFLQELAKFKSVGIIEDTTVYPSARDSVRVYLGTGFRMNQVKNGFDLNKLNFSDNSFTILKKWLEFGTKSSNKTIQEVFINSGNIHEELPQFLKSEKIEGIWSGLQKSSPSDYHFEKQFHRWFDGLKTLRLLKFFSEMQQGPGG